MPACADRDFICSDDADLACCTAGSWRGRQALQINPAMCGTSRYNAWHFCTEPPHQLTWPRRAWGLTQCNQSASVLFLKRTAMCEREMPLCKHLQQACSQRDDRSQGRCTREVHVPRHGPVGRSLSSTGSYLRGEDILLF